MYSVDTTRLHAKIVENRMTMEGLANELGIDRCTFRRRLVSGKLQIRDIHKICDVLNLTAEEAISIFLSKQAHLCDCN